MIIPRIEKECGHADFGWLQAQYTFSFGHYFDPNFTHYGALRVLNRETIAPKAACRAKPIPISISLIWFYRVRLNSTIVKEIAFINLKMSAYLYLRYII